MHIIFALLLVRQNCFLFVRYKCPQKCSVSMSEMVLIVEHFFRSYGKINSQCGIITGRATLDIAASHSQRNGSPLSFALSRFHTAKCLPAGTFEWRSFSRFHADKCTGPAGKQHCTRTALLEGCLETLSSAPPSAYVYIYSVTLFDIIKYLGLPYTGPYCMSMYLNGWSEVSAALYWNSGCK
jgi:hypothetical protein